MDIFDKPQLSHDTYRSWESEQIALREVLTKLWARKRLILLSLIVCATLAFLWTTVMTRVYTGEAQLAIKPQHAGLLFRDQNVPVATQVDPETVLTETFALR